MLNSCIQESRALARFLFLLQLRAHPRNAPPHESQAVVHIQPRDSLGPAERFLHRALMLTTEAMIAEIPEKKQAPAPGGGHGGPEMDY